MLKKVSLMIMIMGLSIATAQARCCPGSEACCAEQSQELIDLDMSMRKVINKFYHKNDKAHYEAALKINHEIIDKLWYVSDDAAPELKNIINTIKSDYSRKNYDLYEPSSWQKQKPSLLDRIKNTFKQDKKNENN